MDTDQSARSQGDMTQPASRLIKDVDSRGRVPIATLLDDAHFLADSVEYARLDCQHEAMKASLGGRNHFEEAFKDIALSGLGGDRKVVLDIATGSGIWAIEFARQFPEVQVIGLDIQKPADRPNLPSNVSFIEADMLEDLPFQDGEIEIVFGRFISPGLQAAKISKLWAEIDRVLKPGGVFYSIEPEYPWTGFTPQGIKGVPAAPGFNTFARLAQQSWAKLGIRTDAATNDIPVVLSNMPYEGFQQRKVPWAFSEWSKDPKLKKSGAFGYKVAPDLYSGGRTLFVEKAKLVNEQEYDRIGKEFLQSLDAPGAFTACWMVHNWATKIGVKKDQPRQ